MATVTPLPGTKPVEPGPSEERVEAADILSRPSPAVKPRSSFFPERAGLRKKSAPGATLDASWDRRLARGALEPDVTVDLHGHTLTSAHAILDAALERARVRGDRVILLITGKPPRRDSERPHTRGAIRAAVDDWLHASRHTEAIAAVRGASPRHGGAGALYIVLRRSRATPKS
ncbi:MAG: Smr/MutS family protein [Proteobacteria bacterium]|nr:Smr/MutS family protein [Pseudomonadota bacterium]